MVQTLTLNRVKKVLKRIKPLYFLWQKVNAWVGKIQGIYYGICPKRLYNLDFRIKHSPPLQKYALLSYIVHPFSISRNNPRFYRHINIWRARKLVQLLNNIGYMVDVIDYTDHKFVPKKKYDIFIGHGHINFARIVSSLPENTIKIYFTASNYWQYYNDEIANRYADLSQRKKINVQPKMIIESVQEEPFRLADGIIAIGGDFSKNTFPGGKPISMINNVALNDHNAFKINRNFDTGRNHFLFFAGADNILKGLDLLLDVFADIGQHLWICSFIDPKIKEIYSDKLYGCSNIHLVGNIFPRGDIFYELVEKCNFVILPSCSEGQPHSVIECMNYGLIPIVSRACSIEVDDFGEIIDCLTIDAIRNVVDKCASYSPDQCRAKSNKVKDIVKSKYSEESFCDSFSSALEYFIHHPGIRNVYLDN